MKKILRSPVMTGLTFALAVVLLFAGGIGGTQAALQYISAEYTTELRLRNIGVELRESTKPDGSAPKSITARYYGSAADGQWTETFGNLIEDMVNDTGDTVKEIKIGREYPFYLTVRNRGDIDEYVRVTIYKYWVDSTETGDKDKGGWVTGNGTKKPDLDGSLISIIPSNSSKWTIEDVTAERMVFYWSDVLPPDGITDPLTSGIRILPGIADKATVVEKTEGNTTYYTYVYTYDGAKFVVEAQVDAVQAKHSDRSVPSAWGVNYVG